jgi:hypothetical protein
MDSYRASFIKPIVSCAITIIFSSCFAGFRTPAAERDLVPTDAARGVATDICREAMLPPRGPAGRPLPLVSHWNMGSQGRGWTPQYQIELLNQGHRQAVPVRAAGQVARTVR